MSNAKQVIVGGVPISLKDEVARDSIGNLVAAINEAAQSGGGEGSDPEAVKFTSQSLNDSQKTQARTNIGAGTYSKPSGGIPASDLASGVVPTVPTISTDISADASSDLKTASPKAVKTYVDEHSGSGTDPEAVKYTSQSLTSEQKEQARANIDAASLEDVTALNDAEYVVAWDGTSTPVVANIPAGVTVTYNTTTYTGTLAASASTAGNIYLVKNSSNYDMYVSTASGSSYSWVFIGSTALDLSGYATKAEVTQLDLKVDDIADNFVTIVSPNLFDKTAATSGKFVNKTSGAKSNSSDWYASDYIDVSGLAVGTKIHIKKSTAYSGSVGMAAYNSSKGFTHGVGGAIEIESGDAYVRVSVPATEIDTAMIYIGETEPSQYMPYGATYYKPKNDADIANLDTKIDNVKADSEGNDTITRRKLTWQPCGRMGVTLLTMSSGSFETAGTAYNVVYRACTEGEMFLCKTTGSHENPIGFCTSIPANGGTYTAIRTIKNTDGEVIVFAPGNGYIVARNDTTGDRDLMLYKLQDSGINTLVPHAITDINETANKMLSVDSGSADYGTLVTAGSNNIFVSDYIDISGYDLVALPFTFGTSNLYLLSAGLFGAIFYDSSKNIHSVVDVTINRVQSSSKAFSIYPVPSGVKYVRFTGIGDVHKCMLGYNREAEASDNLEELVNDVLRNDAAKTGEKTVFETNPDTEMLQKMVIATKKTYDASTIPPLVLAHISDAHGKTSQYSRFLEFARHWKDKGYVDEIIDTGDIVTDTYASGISWREGIEGVEDVITVIGNHDTRASSAERESADYPAGQNQWQYHSNISLDAGLRNDMYNRYFIGPDSENAYVSNWGVTQPEDAETNGYCYFYKDYTSRNLRLIGLDVMGYNNAEDTWLQARLAEAITAGYAVVIIAHFCGEVMTGLPCNYTSLFESGASRTQLDAYNADAHNIPVRVDSFQANGGVFVGYIMGHYHRDMVNILTDYPKQLAFAVSSGGVTPTRDFTKVSGSKSYDDFQVVSINTYDKTVRLIKVGADTDYYMRKKGTISVSYEIVTENGVSRAKGVIGEGW